MRAFRQLCLPLIALVSTGASAQISIPNIVQLPTEDFVWNWGRGRASGFDDQDRPEFSIQGNEREFRCLLTGSFRLGSRMRDFYELREFEQQLLSTLTFIQDATIAMNNFTRTNDLGWATLDCAVPESEVSEDKEQLRLDRAVERAERARERRRRRNDDD